MAKPDRKQTNQSPTVKELADDVRKTQKELDKLRDLIWGEELDADRRPEKSSRA